jgi:hypothetical protein
MDVISYKYISLEYFILLKLKIFVNQHFHFKNIQSLLSRSEHGYQFSL